MSKTPCHEAWADALMDAALGAEGPEVERHLRGCGTCRDALTHLRQAAAAIDLATSELANREASPDFLSRVLTQPRSSSTVSSKRRYRLQAALAAAVLVGILAATARWAVAPSLPPTETEDVVAWRSPTGALLYSESYEALHTVPRLGLAGVPTTALFGERR